MVNLKFGGYQNPASIHNQTAARFGELLCARLGGALDFQLTGNVLDLGRKSGDLPSMVESGELACCYISTVRFTRWVPELAVIDLPFVVNTKGGPLVAFPHTDFADHRVLRANPRDWFEVYKDTFDYLYANEPNSLLNVTVHCHFGGRPLMAAQVDRILKYLRGFPGVWFARHDELAQWVKDNNIAEWTNQERLGPQNARWRLSVKRGQSRAIVRP